MTLIEPAALDKAREGVIREAKGERQRHADLQRQRVLNAVSAVPGRTAREIANALHGAFTLPNVTPGQSQTYSADAVVRTDAAGYDLYIQAPTLLTQGRCSTPSAIKPVPAITSAKKIGVMFIGASIPS